jgi:uncharacterized protein (TIGR03437 family)
MRRLSSIFLFPALVFAQTAGSISTRSMLIASAPSAVDTAGSLYSTSSIYLAQVITPGAAQPQPGGGGSCFYTPGGPVPCGDAYIAKLDPSGNVVFATYLGGPKQDEGTAITFDSAGNSYVGGATGGSFPTTSNAAIPSSTISMAFAAKLNADGTKFLYSTYLPDLMSSVAGIAVDGQGNAIVVGMNGFANSGSPEHACIVKLSADGSTIVYAKTLGGSGKETGVGVAIDAAGNAYITGSTNSSDFPVTPGVVQTTLTGTQNAFVTKLDPAGNVIFSTYLGGSLADTPSAIHLDSTGNIYVGGFTSSLDFPTTAGAYQPSPIVPLWSYTPGGFITKLAPDASSILYSSYVTSGVNNFSLDAAAGMYLAGAGSTSHGLPITRSAPQPCGGYGEGFIVHLDPSGALADSTYFSGGTGGMGVASDGTLLVAGEVFFRIRFGGLGWTPPSCMAQALLNSATLDGTPAVPGALISLVGYGIGPDSGVAASPGTNGYPTTLSGVQVLFDGVPAPITYVQSTQVNAQVPFELAGKASTSITLNYGGATYGPLKVPTQFAAPGFFRLQPDVSTQAYAVNQDGTFNSASNPAPRGSIISLWGTGFGSTDPGCATGGENQPGPANLGGGLSVQVMNGGPVLYAGGAPTLACGIFQVNMVVPANKPAGMLGIVPQVFLPGGLTFSESGMNSFVYIK